MKDYYIYRAGVHVASVDTAQEAVQWIADQIKQFKQVGAKGHPSYKAQYNPAGEGGTVCSIASREFHPEAAQ